MAESAPENPLAELLKYKDVVASCNRCGFCTSYCPTYNATGNEIHSPRGRNQAFRALIEGRITDPERAREAIETCVLCGECTSVCFSEVPTADLMVRARHFLNGMTGIPDNLRFIFEKVLPYPGRLRFMLKLAFLGKRLGLSSLARATGLLKWISPELAAADRLVKRVPLKFLLEYPQAKRLRQAVLRRKAHREAVENHREASAKNQSPAAVRLDGRARVAMMPVCGSQYLRPSIGLATLDLMSRLNVDVVIPDLLCCGLPAASYGVMESVRDIARENIRRLEENRLDAIVADDSSCMGHLKDYPKVFEGDPEWLRRATDMAQRLRENPGFWVQRGLPALLKKTRWRGGPVAFHDPCKAQYGQKSISAPRELLEAIPFLKLAPVPDADQCCGGGGTYSFVHPELSEPILAAKVKNVVSTGCRTLVTSSASCLLQLESGLRRQAPPIQVLHLNEFLARVLAGDTGSA